jgi:hypothetical protein
LPNYTIIKFPFIKRFKAFVIKNKIIITLKCKSIAEKSQRAAGTRQKTINGLFVK